MTNKKWLNRIYSSTNPADLSKVIGTTPSDYVINNSQVEVALRGNQSPNKANVDKGDIVYVAVRGYYNFTDGEKRNSLRVVAKGVVDRIEYRNDIPVAIFAQGSFKYMTAPMINGLDVKRLNKDHRDYETPVQSPYWSITDEEADYIDRSVFSGIKSI